MRPQELKLGSVSPQVKRASILGVLLLAAALRGEALVALFSERAASGDFPGIVDVLRSPGVEWTHAPLVRLLQGIDASLGLAGRGWLWLQWALAMVLAFRLLARVPHWTGFGGAVVAAVLWSATDLTVDAVYRTTGHLLFALLSLEYADFLLRLAQRRASGEAWRLGLRLGLLVWVSGLGVWWLVGTLAWLPLMSHRFRGWSGVRAAGWLLATWVLVLSPVLVRNAIVTGDPAPPFATAAARVLEGAQEQGIAARADKLPVAQSYGARVRQWGDAVEELGRNGSRGWAAAGRRSIAFVGGWTPRTVDVPVALPWWWTPLLAWLGVFALLPSFRAYFPIFLGVGVPAIGAAFSGVDHALLCVASPFVAVFAGYGLQRAWEGRRWAATWILAPALLALGLSLHWMVRSWP